MELQPMSSGAWPRDISALARLDNSFFNAFVITCEDSMRVWKEASNRALFPQNKGIALSHSGHQPTPFRFSPIEGCRARV